MKSKKWINTRENQEVDQEIMINKVTLKRAKRDQEVKIRKRMRKRN